MAKHVIPSDSEEYLQLENLTAAPAIWEDGHRIDTRPGTFEWWYFDAHFDDGSTAVIIFWVKLITERTKGLSPRVQITITSPDGKSIANFPAFKPNEFSASSDRCDVHIGSNWVKGDLNHYDMHVKTADLGAELSFSGLVPPWRPGAGKTFYSNDFKQYFGWILAIPFGFVEGSIFYNGQEHPVKGNCYHDHNWGNIGLESVIDHWYWGRTHIKDFTLTFIEIISSKTYGYQKIHVFLLAKDNQILIENGRPLTVKVDQFEKHSGGRKYPKEVDFHWEENGESVHISLRQPEIIEANFLAHHLPKWQQFLLRLIMNPYYFRFNADIKLDINLTSIKTVETGKAIYEIMLLR